MNETEVREPRKIRVIKKRDIPKLKHNPKLGEVKLTKWDRAISKTREEWLSEHEQNKEEERVRACAESCLG